MEILCLFCDAAPRSPALSEAAQLQNFQEQRGRESPGRKSVSWDRPEEAPLLRAPGSGDLGMPGPSLLRSGALLGPAPLLPGPGFLSWGPWNFSFGADLQHNDNS